MNAKENKDCFEVHWEGPFSKEEVDDYLVDSDDKILAKKLRKYWVLYAAYGSHPLYGRNVLLYVGKTKRGVDKRLFEHDEWFSDSRFGECNFLVASICTFESWDESPVTDDYSKSGRFFSGNDKEIELIEKLMIFALSPAWNTRERKKPPIESRKIRIFNTGSMGDLPPEISGKYWVE